MVLSNLGTFWSLLPQIFFLPRSLFSCWDFDYKNARSFDILQVSEIMLPPFKNYFPIWLSDKIIFIDQPLSLLLTSQRAVELHRWIFFKLQYHGFKLQDFHLFLSDRVFFQDFLFNHHKYVFLCILEHSYDSCFRTLLLVLTSANIWTWFLLILYSWKLVTLWFFFFCQKIWIVLWRLKNFGFCYISVRRVDCFRQLGWLDANC